MSTATAEQFNDEDKDILFFLDLADEVRHFACHLLSTLRMGIRSQLPLPPPPPSLLHLQRSRRRRWRRRRSRR